MDLKKQITFVLDFYWLRYKPTPKNVVENRILSKTIERTDRNIPYRLYLNWLD